MQQLGRGQRVIVFVLFMVGGVMAILAVTLLLISLSLGSSPRVLATALLDGVSVREFSALPDDDAYPAALAVGADGVVYTGSRATGTVWAISAQGTAVELPGTRDSIGAVNGLAVAPDGALLVLDRLTSDPRASGGQVWRVRLGAPPEFFATIQDANGFVSPGDLTVDAAGRVYATDRGRGLVWQWDADGADGRLWWVPPADVAGVIPTGLAYDPVHDAILVTDSEQNTVYRVSIRPDGGADGTGELLYRYTGARNLPSFTGITVAADGTVYIAALGQNGVVRLDGGDITYIAGLFRGVNDVAVGPDGRLYAANFDSRGLVVPLVQPQLPFAIDVIEFDTSA